MSTLIQRSLGGGELDPALWPRSDITKYMTGLRTLRNAVVRRNGGALARPASVKCASVKDSTNTVRLIPFIYGSGQNYMMEFGNFYIRFYQNGSPQQAVGATAWSSGTTYHVGDLVTSGGITYYCCKASTSPPATSITKNGINFGQNGVLYGSTSHSAGSLNQTPASNTAVWYPLTGTTYEIPSPYAVADLAGLKYDQTANDISITHPSYPPFRLTRFLDRSSHFAFACFYIQQGSYLSGWGLTVTNSGANADAQPLGHSTYYTYAVVPVSATGDEYAQTGSETPGLIITTTTTDPASGTNVLTIQHSSQAVLYNIYRTLKSGTVFGFIGTATPFGNPTSFTYTDTGLTPDFSNSWVIDQGQLFQSANTSPSCCAYYQQRLIYANSNNFPTRSWASQTGIYDNFNINVPSVATDSFNFQLVGQQDTIQHLVNLSTLLVFTYGSENSVRGDASGAISPSAINSHRDSVHGCSSLKPLVVGDNAIYNQAQGSVIRDLGYNFQVDGYRGDDLTIFATHLFDNYTIVDWTYQVTPNSIVWAVRSDGTLLSMTYVREQQILGWAHHDTLLGSFENVACIPEGSQSSVYMVVKRTIAGSTVRYVERMSSQQYTNINEFIGVDCATTFDGRNTTADTMTLSGGTLWNETELLTLTLSANNFLTFTSSDATNNNYIFLYDPTGVLVRFKITARSSNTVVTGFVDRTVPVSMQSTALVTWSYAIKNLTGLDYLTSLDVSVFADGFVVGSPNNPAYPVYNVSAGTLTLDKHYAVIHVGLPFITDIETLDIDTPGPSDSINNKLKLVGEVTLHMVNSRSVWVGGSNPDNDPSNTVGPLYRLTEQKLRQNENYDSPINLVTGKITQNIQPDYDANGHVFIRNVDPTPLLIAAISPDGLFPMRGA